MTTQSEVQEYGSWYGPLSNSEEYKQVCCAFCEHYNIRRNMTEKNGDLLCSRCISLPPYSDKLYNAIVSFQRLFRAYFKKKANPCGNCGRNFLYLHNFRTEMGPMCYFCIQEELDEIREQYERDDESGPCEDCGNYYECDCAEEKEEERLRHHRRICGIKKCDGDCGTLPCGCIDVCRGRCGMGHWSF